VDPQILFTSPNLIGAALAEIRDLRGRPVHVFENEVIVVRWWPFERPSEDLFYWSSVREPAPGSLGEGASQLLDAWNLVAARRSLTSTSAVACGGADGTDNLEECIHPSHARAAPTSDDKVPWLLRERSLIGSTWNTILVIDGTDPDVSVSETARLDALANLLEGTDWLANLEIEAQASFHHELRHVTLSVHDRTLAELRACVRSGTGDCWEQFEAYWRDPALAKLGLPTGQEGVREYARSLPGTHHVDWGLVSFLTSYRARRAIYAEQDYWVGRIDATSRNMSHEVAHTYGALDEYGSCSCTTKGGVLGIPNANCKACSEAPLPCIMGGAPGLDLCPTTRAQLGWTPEYIAQHVPRPPSPIQALFSFTSGTIPGSTVVVRGLGATPPNGLNRILHEVASARVTDGVVVDPLCDRIYWTTDNKLWSATLTGGDLRILRDVGDNGQLSTLTLEPLPKALFWCETGPGGIKLMRLGPDSDEPVAIADINQMPTSLYYDRLDSDLYLVGQFGAQVCGTSGQDLRAVDWTIPVADGRHVKLSDNPVLSIVSDVLAPNRYVLVGGNNQGIYATSTSGMLRRLDRLSKASGFQAPGLALSPNGATLYWLANDDTGTSQLWSAPVTGTEEPTRVAGIAGNTVGANFQMWFALGMILRPPRECTGILSRLGTPVPR
jgi:hypothetical protein